MVHSWPSVTGWKLKISVDKNEPTEPEPNPNQRLGVAFPYKGEP
jgi:hypothetical protein